MILKIEVIILCTIVLIIQVTCSLQYYQPCRSRYTNEPYNSLEYCDVLASEVNERTWYQAEAFLKVIDGNFTVELLSNNSAPSSVDAEGKGIVRLNRGFAMISSLVWLSFEDNFIERIESSVFEGLPELVYLSLARNRIEYLDADSFQGLGKLEILSLNHNVLTTLTRFPINEDILPVLTQLYVQHNQLKNVDDLCHSNLEHLYLSNNSIGTFHLEYSQQTQCLKNLTHLFLEDNKIYSVSIGTTNRLEALSLDGNHFDFIPKIGPKMKFLSLARNRIRRIYNFEKAENIVRLILSYNLIVMSKYDWEMAQFQNFSSLEHLALDHNFLTSIPNGVFYNLTSLRSLYLNDNKIDNISPKAFEHLPALEKLSFVNNQLTSFPGKESFGKSNLKYLDFSNNKVENISDLQLNMIPELKVLNLDGNPLKRMDLFCSNITILL